MIPDTASDTRHPLSFSLGFRGRDWAARGVVFRRGDYSTEEQSDCSRPTSCCVSTLPDILKHALVICQPLADIIISLTALFWFFLFVCSWSLTDHRRAFHNQNWITFNSYTVSFLRDLEKREKCVIYKEKRGTRTIWKRRRRKTKGTVSYFGWGVFSCRDQQEQQPHDSHAHSLSL